MGFNYCTSALYLLEQCGDKKSLNEKKHDRAN
nr:MAG TPA: hypothetical protein [Caudoviricetes sp.]